MSFLRATLPRFWTLAWGEARFAAAAARSHLRHAAIWAGWAATAIFLGSFVGLAAVVLPPKAMFGIILVPALVLLWVLPELPTVAESTVRRVFFAFVVVGLCVPGYYAFTIPGTGLPWISVRRLFISALIILFGYNYAVSSTVRAKIARILRSDYFLSSCVILSFVWILLSIFTSISPMSTLEQFMTVFLEMYAPFFAALYVIDNEENALRLVLTICWCSVFVATAGIIEFFVHKNLFLLILPQVVKSALAEDNPTFSTLLAAVPMRDGSWRSSSVLISGIGFAEFETMITPVAYALMLHGRSLRMRAFGAVLIVLSFAANLCSGSRGGLVGVLAATAYFTAIWVVRSVKFKPRNLAPVVVATVGALLLAIAIPLILFWPRAHNMVLGGGGEAASDEGRRIQWMMGIPHILSNPITGHGFGLGGTIIGWQAPGSLFPSVDSGILSMLVEIGIPGTIFFFGMPAVACWRGLQRYVSDPSFGGAISGGISATMVSFLVITTVLSQHDNYSFLMTLVACMTVLHYFDSARRRQSVSLRSGASTSARSPRVAKFPPKQPVNA
jgi:O-antigen ligase